MRHERGAVRFPLVCRRVTDQGLARRPAAPAGPGGDADDEDDENTDVALQTHPDDTPVARTDRVRSAADGDGDGRLTHAGLEFCHRVIRHPAPAMAPTLFVSGAFQTMDSWARFARVFGAHATVILVDPPGMGRSEVLPADVGVDVLAGCLHRVIEEHGFERVNVVAASYGTPAAHRLAQLHPGMIGRVALAGTMRVIPLHLRDRVQGTVGMAERGDRAALADEVVDGMLCRDPLLAVDRRELAARILHANLRRMTDAELRQYAANTSRLLRHDPVELTPRILGPEALVFTGEHDCFTVPDDGREVALGFERAWFTLVERADHLFHIERFDVVAQLLLTFMQGRLDPHPTGCTPLEWMGVASVDAVDA